jgi:hypothetical protein
LPIAGIGSSHPQQKERRSFRRPVDAEKWCEIHQAIGHNLEECRMYLDRKKMLDKLAAQEPRRRDHRRAANSDNNEQLGEININFGATYQLPPRVRGRSLSGKSTWLNELIQREE